jgi:hypothetical protein
MLNTLPCEVAGTPPLASVEPKTHCNSATCKTRAARHAATRRADLPSIATGGGFLPSPVSGVVEIDGNKYIFTTDNPLNPGGVIPITINVPQKRFRTYWKELVD